MANEKKSDFVVSDRRKFTTEGELKPDAPVEESQPEETQTADIDARIQKELDQRSPGRRASDFEMTFDKFIASLYMTALMQLGLVQEQGMQARPDIMAARQTIDTISILAEKTKGNLTPAEETLVQNVLYELRMAYVEVTNALTRPPQGPIDPNAGLK